uniref:Galectin n=1 Tax=Meloidogyne floridensis TaxID=298350 RepID=A0A915P935_9BILA
MNKNFMNTGSRIEVKIRLTKYYVWAYILINQHEKFLKKFWPEKWWEGKFFNESEVDIVISGDFGIFTPVYIKPVNGKEFNELAGIFNHAIKMPYSFEPKETVSKEVHHKFIFMVNTDASEFYIRLMNGEPDENKYIGITAYGLFVNFTENTITTYTMDVRKFCFIKI